MAAATPINLDTVPGNWFDGVAVILLIVGILRGRKRGMSEELLSLFQWLTVLVVCSLYYERLGSYFARFANVTLLFGYVFVYAVLLLGVVLVFGVIKRGVGEKLVGSDLFGRLEYYLGMLAGLVRFFCYLLVFLALVNGPVFTAEEIMAAKKKQKDDLGDTFFPSLGQIHFDITRGSLTGRLVREHLSTVLIQPTSTAPPPGKQKETLGQRRTKEWQAPTQPKP
jgi:uncharacterized membrane protein required for colicin V production